LKERFSDVRQRGDEQRLSPARGPPRTCSALGRQGESHWLQPPSRWSPPTRFSICSTISAWRTHLLTGPEIREAPTACPALFHRRSHSCRLMVRSRQAVLTGLSRTIRLGPVRDMADRPHPLAAPQPRFRRGPPAPPGFLPPGGRQRRGASWAASVLARGWPPTPRRPGGTGPRQKRSWTSRFQLGRAGRWWPSLPELVDDGLIAFFFFVRSGWRSSRAGGGRAAHPAAPCSRGAARGGDGGAGPDLLP